MTTNTNEDQYKKDARIYEYGSAANPDMPPIPVLIHPRELHESGATRIVPFDLSAHMEISEGAATSPNLLASFIRINEGDTIPTKVTATSQAFYVIRGEGTSTSVEHGTMSWSTGDMFVLPVTPGEISHTCTKSTMGGAALYWIHDQPLLDYLGVAPSGVKKFEPTLYKKADMLDKVEEIRHDDTRSNNRLGVLLGNAKCAQTKTLTHVLWSLLNSIGPNTVQRPHRHNSIALDLCVAAGPDANVYTLMGREIDANGLIIDPIRCDWVPGGCFITPPGWWHSHHNESDQEAWVLPVQDAGLFTHQRTLDIRFVDDELALHHSGRIRGSAFVVTNKQFSEIKELGEQQKLEETNYCDAAMADSSHHNLLDSDEEDEQEEEKECEEKKDGDRRRASINVGDLSRKARISSSSQLVASSSQLVGSNSQLGASKKSIQIGADLKYLKSIARPATAI